MRTLLAGAGRYKGLAFDERGTQLAFISDRDDFHADASDGGQGMSRAFQYERGTGRMGGPPWERAQRFIENSPIFWVDKVTTPYLTIHNDEDDAVPWYQGIEFFSALRRLGKEAYMFNSTRHRIDGPIPSPSFYLFGSGLVAAGLGLERAPSGGRSQVYCRSRA